KDSMGEMAVPKDALYGASTQRAVLNFPVSGYRFSRPFIRALGLIKWGAAQANHDLGLLDAHRSALIVQAAEEVIEGKLDQHFQSEEHTSELQSRVDLVCRLLLEKKKEEHIYKTH